MHAYLAEDTEKALLLDKLGFDELFIGEHFSAATEPYPSPLMFAASLLDKTRAAGVRHRRGQRGDAPSRADRGRSGAVRSHEQGPLHPRHRHRLDADRQSSCWTYLRQRERGNMLVEFDRNDRENLGQRTAVRSRRANSSTQRSRTRSIRRLALAGCRSPIRRAGRRSRSRRRRRTRARSRLPASKGLGVISSQLIADDDLALHWQNYREGCQEARPRR